MKNSLKSIIVPLILLTERAFSAEIISFYSDSKSKVIELSDEKCEVLLDNTLNYRVTKVLSTVTIEALRNNLSGALLIITCPNKDDALYELSYENRLITADAPPDVVSIKTQPESFIENKFSYGPNQQAQWTFNWTDRTLPEAEIRVSRSKSLNGPLSNAESQDIAHHINAENLVYYGTAYQRSQSSSSRSYRGGFQTAPLSAGLERIFYDTRKRSDSYYGSLPGPFSLQFTGRDGPDGAFNRSLSRSWLFRSQYVSSRTNLTGRINNAIKSASVGQIFSNVLSERPIAIWINQQTMIFCIESKSCRVSELALGPSWKSGPWEGQITHYLIPHSSQIKLSWKPNQRRAISIAYRRDLIPINWLKKYSLDPDILESAIDTKPKVDGDLNLFFREGLVQSRLSYAQPLYPNQSRKDAILSFGLGEEREKLTWDVSVTQQIWNRKTNPSLLASIRLYTDNNLKRASQKLKSHSIHGNVLSSVTGKPLPNAKLTLTKSGKLVAEKTSNSDGSYSFLNIPSEGDLEISAVINNSHVTKKITKDISESIIRQDIQIQDYLIIKVEFYVDTNKNSAHDKDDLKLNLKNELPEIQDAIVHGDEAIVATDQLLFPRDKIIHLEAQKPLLPARYDLIDIFPNDIDSKTEQTTVVKVLLKDIL